MVYEVNTAIWLAEVAGRLGDLLVDLGSRVSKGQPVARLVPTDFTLHVSQADAALQQARARLGLSPDGKDDRVDPEKTPGVRQARAMLDTAIGQERAELFPDPGDEARMREADLDALNRRLGDALIEDGRVFAGTTVYDGKVALRPAMTNWRITEADVDSFVAVVREIAGGL